MLESSIKFSAEVTQVQVKKLLSGDREYKVVLVTTDPRSLDLQQYIAEEPITVEVK